MRFTTLSAFSVATLFALFSTTSVAAARSTESLNIRAWIDGRSRLILDDATATWQHFDFAAPGRLNCDTGSTVEPTYLDALPWYPNWPDVPTCENRSCGGCLSSTFDALTHPIPNWDSAPQLFLNSVRDSCAIIEYPSASNGYSIVIEFDDDPSAGADWYDVTLVFTDCGASHYCVSTPNSSGAAATIAASGSFSVFANDTKLAAAGCPANRPGLFFYGPNPMQMPFANGYLCVSPFAPGLTRIAPAVFTDPAGGVQLALDLTRLPPPMQITGGTTWYFQFWFRDLAAGGAGSNLSDGLRATFCP